MAVHVSMIVRNEKDRHLHRALTCAKRVAELGGGVLAITDDASLDGTDGICLEYGAILRANPEPQFWQHEGLARQENYDFMSGYCAPGDWVLSLDADETVNSPEVLVREVERASEEGMLAIGMPLHEFWSEDQYRVDGYWFGTKATRLYAWQEHGKIAQREMGCGSEPTYVADAVRQHKVTYSQDLHLLHWGYLRSHDRHTKYRRYMDRLNGHGHNTAHVESIITEPVLETYPW